jgi:hypothetical protein
MRKEGQAFLPVPSFNTNILSTKGKLLKDEKSRTGILACPFI